MKNLFDLTEKFENLKTSYNVAYNALNNKKEYEK